MVRDDNKKFAAADIDGDGSLSNSEYRSFYHPWMAPHMHELEVERTRKEFDTNADGFIDANEFLAGSGE